MYKPYGLLLWCFLSSLELGSCGHHDHDTFCDSLNKQTATKKTNQLSCKYKDIMQGCKCLLGLLNENCVNNIHIVETQNYI